MDEQLELQLNKLRSLRKQFAGNGRVPVALVRIYDEARKEIEKLTEQDFSALAARQLGAPATGSVFVIALYPAIDQILLATEALLPREEREEASARVGRMVALIEDTELRLHCADILSGQSRFNRAIIVATTVLEDRVRSVSQAPGSLYGAGLVNACIKADPAESLLVLSQDAGEQRGFADMARGIVGLYRNQHHHKLVAGVTRAQALKVCLCIDEMLRLLAGCAVNGQAKVTW